MPPKKSYKCNHDRLTFSPSPHAVKAGYTHPSLAKRSAATTARGTANSTIDEKSSVDPDLKSSTFPAPLVLPGDELSWDPACPEQSFRSWSRLKERNAVTSTRRTIYFTGPPVFEPGLEFASSWSQPRSNRGTKEKAVEFPKTSDVLSYLEAFYHGMPVKMLPSPNPSFTADVDDNPPPTKKGKKSSKKVPDTKSPTLWLNTHTKAGCIGIRSRATPNGEFSHQLNLNDLLDAAIEILPADAYALLMLVDHDIFEDEQDDFACGRAYGGSRIAVVSGARYNPILDTIQQIDRDHAWPASHCQKYVQSCCDAVEDSDEMEGVQKSQNMFDEPGELGTAMHAALSAHRFLPSPSSSPSKATLSGLWLGRVCRTAGHELGHCFGIGHCTYYACSMQGTASIIEDARQPLFLCPIDLAKVLKATGADRNDRYKTLLAFCEKNKDAHLFAAFGAWIRARLS